jgi:hypothetical protein
MKYLKRVFENTTNDAARILFFDRYKQSILKNIEDNFNINVFDFIDEFIHIEDSGVDVDIKFIINFKNRDKYPQNRNFDIVKNRGSIKNNIYQTELINRRTMYESRFEYGLTYCGYPIDKNDITNKFISVFFINQKNPSTSMGDNLHFLDKFKYVISEICKKYQLKVVKENSTMEKIGYTSYNILLDNI